MLATLACSILLSLPQDSGIVKGLWPKSDPNSVIGNYPFPAEPTRLARPVPRWHVMDPAIVGFFPAQDAPAFLAVSEDNKFVATGSISEKMSRIYELQLPTLNDQYIDAPIEQLKHMSRFSAKMVSEKGVKDIIYDIAYSPQTKHFAVVCDDKNVFVFNSSGNLAWTLDGNAREINQIRYSPSGNLIAWQAKNTIRYRPANTKGGSDSVHVEGVDPRFEFISDSVAVYSTRDTYGVVSLESGKVLNKVKRYVHHDIQPDVYGMVAASPGAKLWMVPLFDRVKVGKETVNEISFAVLDMQSNKVQTVPSELKLPDGGIASPSNPVWTKNPNLVIFLNGPRYRKDQSMSLETMIQRNVSVSDTTAMLYDLKAQAVLDTFILPNRFGECRLSKDNRYLFYSEINGFVNVMDLGNIAWRINQ